MWGLTGGYGTGKSTVARMFQRLGARVINADSIAHALLSLKTPTGRKVLATFGNAVLWGGRISRRRLGQVVFSDLRKLSKLEKIIHPAVLKEMRRWERRTKKGGKVLVAEVPLLIEAGMHREMDGTILVTTDRRTQVERLKRRRGIIDTRMALKRIKRQMSLTQKKKYADFIVDNRNSRRETYQQVKRIWENLKK
jgi:dephospho-CoA kinase